MPPLNRTSIVMLHDTSINSNVGTSRVIRRCCLQRSEFQRGATGTRGFPEVPTRLTCCSRRYRAEWSLTLFTHNILESGTGTHGMYVPTRSSFGEFYSCLPHIESLFCQVSDDLALVVVVTLSSSPRSQTSRARIDKICNKASQRSQI